MAAVYIRFRTISVEYYILLFRLFLGAGVPGVEVNLDKLNRILISYIK